MYMYNVQFSVQSGTGADKSLYKPNHTLGDQSLNWWPRASRQNSPKTSHLGGQVVASPQELPGDDPIHKNMCAHQLFHEVSTSWSKCVHNLLKGFPQDQARERSLQGSSHAIYPWLLRRISSGTCSGLPMAEGNLGHSKTLPVEANRLVSCAK